MNIPESVIRAYETEMTLIEPVRHFASSRLRLLANNNSWLFDDRVKSIESALSKMEADGKPLSDIHDLYAAMIVVPTHNHVESAVKAVVGAFSAEVRPRRSSDASSFVYDDIHIIASLRDKVSPRVVPHPSCLDRRFEIQIHTGVQYAWWRATHDSLYKGSSETGRSWAAKRASGQARAALELIDGVMADFETAASLQTITHSVQDPGESVRSWLFLWPKRSRPADELRFTDTVVEACKIAGIELGEVEKALFSGSVDDLIANVELTPIQIVLIVCHKIRGDALFGSLKQSGRKVLITEEMVHSYPPFGALPAHHRAAP